MISWEAEQLSKRPRRKRRDQNIISFSVKDLVRIYNPNNDPIVVSMMKDKHPIRKILVDSRSSINMLFYDTFVHMNLPLSQLKLVSMPLVAFNEESIKVEVELLFPLQRELCPNRV